MLNANAPLGLGWVGHIFHATMPDHIFHGTLPDIIHRTLPYAIAHALSGLALFHQLPLKRTLQEAVK